MVRPVDPEVGPAFSSLGAALAGGEGDGRCDCGEEDARRGDATTQSCGCGITHGSELRKSKWQMTAVNVHLRRIMGERGYGESSMGELEEIRQMMAYP